MDTVWTALKTLLAHPWRWMLARWPWRHLIAWWTAMKWAERRTWQRRWAWGRRKALWAVGALAIILGLGWLGLWDAIGAAVDRTSAAFQSFTAEDLASLYISKRVEAFRNMLWGLSVAAGAVVAILTLVFVAWRTWNEARRADTERRKLETETFATAMEQLGNKDFAIRLGAILNLETLARDSRRLHQPIVEAFCAYLQEKTHTPSPLLPKGWLDELARGAVKNRIQLALKNIKPFRTDLQAIVTALGRRTATQDRPGYRLDLRGATLRKADLQDGQFQGADLRGAHLEGATLRGAHLEGATLRRAHLEGADLRGAHLEGATLRYAHLEGADLRGAHLEGATLRGAHLEGADLTDAHLEGAYLRGTDVTQGQLDSAHGDANTKIPRHLTPPAHWT